MSIEQIDEPIYTVIAIETNELRFYLSKLKEIANLRSVPFNTINNGKKLLKKNIDRREAIVGLADILSAHYDQTVPMAEFVAEIIEHSPGQAETVKKALEADKSKPVFYENVGPSASDYPTPKKQSEMTAPIVVIDD